MEIINLTPHAVRIYRADGVELTVIPPSGRVARISVARKLLRRIEAYGVEVPVYAPTYSKLEGLPDRVPGTYYLVSALLRQALLYRLDLLSPGELIRDAAGQPKGCIGLDGNF